MPEHTQHTATQHRWTRWVLILSLSLISLLGSTSVSAQQAPEERARPAQSSTRVDRERAQPESYGVMLLKMLLGVMLISALAYLVIRYGLRRFLPGAQHNEAMQVLLRQPLEPKRALLVVRVASRHLLLASSESGVSLLTELSEDDVAQMIEPPPHALPRKKSIPREFSLELEEPAS